MTNLEKFYKLRHDFYNHDELDYDSIEYFTSIEKQLKALEIIKRREIDVKDITETTDNYELYVAYCEGKGYADDYICSKEEFNLLREVFGG